MAYQLYVAEFPNGKRYFGITKFHLSKRIRLHFSAAINKRSHFRVHSAIREYGDEARSFFRTLVIGPKGYIAALEDRMIAEFRTSNPAFGYNMAKSSPPLMTPEVAAKISATLRGRKKSPEHIARAAAGRRGIANPVSSRAKMSAAWERNRAANLARLRLMKPSDETRAKMSLARKGKPSPMAGRKHTDEARAKMRVTRAALKRRIKIDGHDSGGNNRCDRSA